jgi:hypothetical protein
LERVADWPEGAQQDAALALKDIEERLAWERKLSAEDRAKLAALREMVRNSIAEGGDNSPDDVDAMIDEMAARSAQAR